MNTATNKATETTTRAIDMSTLEDARDALFAELDQGEAIAAAHAADTAYGAELRRVFGKKAGDARYDARGTSTPELRRLSAAKLAVDAAAFR